MDVLSQDEVNALLRGVTGEDDESPPHAANAAPYRLGLQERIVRGRLPALELIYEKFARFLRTDLYHYMGHHAEISAGIIRVHKYSAFLRNLNIPNGLNVVHIHPLGGAGLFCFDPNLVFIFSDLLFGGQGTFHTRTEGRDFSPVEHHLIKDVLGVVFKSYRHAWQPVADLSFKHLRSELNTQFVNIASPSEIVVSTCFTLEFNGVAADMHICIPYSVLGAKLIDQLRSGLQSDHVTESSSWQADLKENLQYAEMPLTANLATIPFTLKDILALKKGDVLPLKMNKGHIVQATVENRPVASCRYGQSNGHYALFVNSTILFREKNDCQKN